MYYQFSDEALALAKQSPQLLTSTALLLFQWTPNLKELITDGRTTVSAADMTEVDQLLEAYAQNGSDKINEAIRMVQKQIVDPEVQRALGLTVVRDDY